MQGVYLGSNPGKTKEEDRAMRHGERRANKECVRRLTFVGNEARRRGRALKKASPASIRRRWYAGHPILPSHGMFLKDWTVAAGHEYNVRSNTYPKSRRSLQTL